jgi:hypothetical protein
VQKGRDVPLGEDVAIGAQAQDVSNDVDEGAAAGELEIFEEIVAEEADLEGVKEVVAVKVLEHVEGGFAPERLAEMGGNVNARLYSEHVVSIGGDRPDEGFDGLFVERCAAKQAVQEQREAIGGAEAGVVVREVVSARTQAFGCETMDEEASELLAVEAGIVDRGTEAVCEGANVGLSVLSGVVGGRLREEAIGAEIGKMPELLAIDVASGSLGVVRARPARADGCLNIQT